MISHYGRRHAVCSKLSSQIEALIMVWEGRHKSWGIFFLGGLKGANLSSGGGKILDNRRNGRDNLSYNGVKSKFLDRDTNLRVIYISGGKFFCSYNHDFLSQ